MGDFFSALVRQAVEQGSGVDFSIDVCSQEGSKHLFLSMFAAISVVCAFAWSMLAAEKVVITFS